MAFCVTTNINKSASLVNGLDSCEPLGASNAQQAETRNNDPGGYKHINITTLYIFLFSVFKIAKMGSDMFKILT